MSNIVPITDPKQTDTNNRQWAPLSVLQVVLEQLEQTKISFCH